MFMLSIVMRKLQQNKLCSHFWPTPSLLAYFELGLLIHMHFSFWACMHTHRYAFRNIFALVWFFLPVIFCFVCCLNHLTGRREKTMNKMKWNRLKNHHPEKPIVEGLIHTILQWIKSTNKANYCLINHRSIGDEKTNLFLLCTKSFIFYDVLLLNPIFEVLSETTANSLMMREFKFMINLILVIWIVERF